MPPADESNHSAAGMLHPHYIDGHTTTAYTALAQCHTIKIHQIQIWLTYTAKNQAERPIRPVPPK